MVKVLFLGPLGTYSHQAAIQQFPNEEFIAVSSIPECFNRLISDDNVDYGVVPLENSTNGQVTFTYDLFRDFMNEDTEPLVEVVGEQYVSIEHCLISPIKLTDEQLQKVDTIYSHPQVWGQVKDYLETFQKKYGKCNRIDCNSTSEAVSQSRKEFEKDGTISLSIASRASSLINNSCVVESGINDIKGNTTRFLVLKKRSNHSQILKSTLETKENPMIVNFVTFVINQDGPGSLVDVLNVLKLQNLSMCSISSRPFHQKSKVERKWQYCFFIEYYENEHFNNSELSKGFDENCAKWIHWGRFFRDPSYYRV